MNTLRLLQLAMLLLGMLGLISTGEATPVPASGQPKPRLSFKACPERLRTIAFTPDGKKLLSLGQDCAAKLWDVSNGKLIATFKGHGTPGPGRLGTITRVALSPDGKTIASAGIDRSIRLWDVATGENVTTLTQPANGVPTFLLYSPDGKKLLSLGWNSFLWDLKTKKERAIMEGLDTNHMIAATFDPKGYPLVVTWQQFAEPPSFRLWTLDSDKKPTPAFNVPAYGSSRDGVNSIAFRPDGKTIASGNGDHTVRFWDPATGKNTDTIEKVPGVARGLAFSPDGKILAIASREPPAKPRDPLALPPNPGELTPYAVRLYEVATGKVLATLKGMNGSILPPVFSPDGRTLATVDGGSKITLWSLPAVYSDRSAKK